MTKDDHRASGAEPPLPSWTGSVTLPPLTGALGVLWDVILDVVAPDHTPPNWPLRTARGRNTIQITGGRQALQRSVPITVTKDDRSAPVPVPDLLGALVLKAAAWLEDNRDRERHSQDAALLASLISDPIAERRRFRGSDRKRLLKLHTALADPHDPAWTNLGEHGPDAFTTWQILIS